jgi:hypothetical protein
LRLHATNTEIAVFKRLLPLVALLAIAGQGSAQPVPSPASTADAEQVESSAEGLEADAVEYSRMFAVAPAEALRRIEAQEASVAMVDRLVETYRDRLAGVLIEHQPIYRIVIVVTGTPVTETQIANAPFDVPIILRTGALATRADTLAAIERHQGDIRAALSSPPGMTVDPQTGKLLVLIKPGERHDAGDREAIEARLGEIAGMPVEVGSWGDVDTDLSVVGGSRVVGANAADSGQFVCTSGFVVADGVQTALSTAAHCPDFLNFVDSDGTRTPLTMIGAWGARYQDVQLHIAPMPLRPLFHAEDAIRARALVTWRNRSSTRAGDFVCHRGLRSGYSCALVQYVDYAPPGDLCAGPCPATWVAVSGTKCKGGDSGGPVFVGSVAFGLVKGDSSKDGICKLYYYMSTDYLPPGWLLLHG